MEKNLFELSGLDTLFDSLWYTGYLTICVGPPGSKYCTPPPPPEFQSQTQSGFHNYQHPVLS